MLEVVGIIFGGVSRLFQHHMDLKDKQRERDHEARMFDKQMALADKRFEHDSALRRMDAESADAQAEWAAMTAAIEAQAREAQAAGGLVAKFSAAMRPFLTFWHAVVMYSIVKVALFWLAFDDGLNWAEAVKQIYGEFDRALVGTIVSYWFADRSLRKLGRG